MADSQPYHEPTDPTQQQDDIFRVFAFVLGGTIASLASLWTFAQVILFVDPFFLLWVPWVALGMLLLMAGVLILYLWDQFFRQETDGNWRTPFPLFTLMFLMSWVALKDTSEEEIAQKLLADRGMKMSSEEIGIQLALLNHSALSLFGRAGIITDNIFEVLGQQSPYVSNGEPVVLDMIDKVKSIDDPAQQNDTVEKLRGPRARISTLQRSTTQTGRQDSKQPPRNAPAVIMAGQYAFVRGEILGFMGTHDHTVGTLAEVTGNGRSDHPFPNHGIGKPVASTAEEGFILNA